ncbi:MAG: hypothetical protein ACTSO9_18235 [Candidatus Helarchaeota archaeon]
MTDFIKNELNILIKDDITEIQLTYISALFEKNNFTKGIAVLLSAKQIEFLETLKNLYKYD